MTQQVQMRP